MKTTTNLRQLNCAIYTRKSTEEGLEQEFNTLDAQRESAECYIKSQEAEGWVCLPEHYDDGGYTGGNMERPALKRLLADIEAGKVDCVVVYKVDRLSRSLMGFAKMLEVFERKRVAFVSVTQQFNTTNSMGRLMLNVLLSFAQFEREIISERTRDKMAAARRKGKERGGRHFDKSSLFKLLTNMAYIGKIRYKEEVHNGEHEPIVPVELWDRVQKLLKHNGKTGGIAVRNKFGALLKGLVRCICCDAAMTPNHTTKAGNKRYRYYVCSSAQKRGWHTCPSKSIPAKQIEDFVVSQVKKIGYAPEILKEVVEATKLKSQKHLLQLKEERVTLERDSARWNNEIFKMTSQIATSETNSPAVARLADLQERIQHNERRMLAINKELAEIDTVTNDAPAIESAVLSFDPIWEAMTLRDQIRLINMIVKRVDYDGESGRVTITFHPVGGKSQAEYAAKDLSQV